MLQDVPFSQLNVGDKVLSVRGRPGVVSLLDEKDQKAIWIDWTQESPWHLEMQTQSCIQDHMLPFTGIQYLGT